MKYKVGDRVRVQSLEQYNKYKNRHGDINYGCETEILFTSEMSSLCGQVVTITRVRYIGCVRFYHIAEDEGAHLWVAGMFGGLVEEETKPKFKVGDVVYSKTWQCNVVIHEILPDRVYKVGDLFRTNWFKEHEDNLFIYKFVRLITEYTLPDGHIFKDENGNVINATKIVLEKKKEYPKTYEECCEIMNVIMETEIVADAYSERLDDYELNLDTKIENLRKLLICRDAYWKIVGDEMGLGKPWEPAIQDTIWGITRSKDEVENYSCHYGKTNPFEFPTEKMRDAFKENFKGLIEECKELL